jgi:arylsulfatase A-like enzyme
VITADHGEGLGEHGHYTHSRYLYQGDVGIPLLFYDAPGVAYQNLDYPWQPDIGTTILARLGLPMPTSWQGRSLLDEQDNRFTFHSTQRNPTSHAVIYETGSKLYKYLVQLPPWGKENVLPAQESLFELTGDSHEQYSIMNAADPALVTLLKEEMNAEFSLGR